MALVAMRCVWLAPTCVADEPETRDAWWEEIRQEIKSHAKALGCHAVVGYSESTSIWCVVVTHSVHMNGNPLWFSSGLRRALLHIPGHSTIPYLTHNVLYMKQLITDFLINVLFILSVSSRSPQRGSVYSLRSRDSRHFESSLYARGMSGHRKRRPQVDLNWLIHFINNLHR